jgi:hypothetical protein
MVLKTAKIDMHRKTDFFEVVSQFTGFKLFFFESALKTDLGNGFQFILEINPWLPVGDRADRC